MQEQKDLNPEETGANALVRKVDSAIDALETISFNCVLDSVGGIVNLNPGFSELIQAPRAPGSVTGIIPFLRKTGHLRTAVRVIRTLRRNEQFKDELKLGEGPDSRWFDVHVIPRHDSDSTLNGAVVVLLDVTERRLMHEALAHHAFHDALTGLPNRRLLMDRMMQARYRSDRFHDKFAVIYLDLDYFKEVNDKHGHRVGDAVLIEVGTRLVSLLRRDDTVCRLGGDEFILLLPGIKNPPDLFSIAQEIVDKISEPILFEDHACKIGASLGISLYPDDAEDREKLIQLADRALYRAKQDGRNQFVFYGSHGSLPFREGHSAGSRQTGTASVSPCYDAIFRSDDLALIGFDIRFSRDKQFSEKHDDRRGHPPGLSEDALVELYDSVFAEYAAWKGERSLPLLLVFHLPGDYGARSRVLAALQRAIQAAKIPPQEIAVSIRNPDPRRIPDAFSGGLNTESGV